MPSNTGEAALSPAQAVADAINDGKTHLLLAASGEYCDNAIYIQQAARTKITGSVASIKVPLIAQAFAHVPNLSVRILLTPNAARFLAGQSAEQPSVASLLQIPNVDAVYQNDDDDEWNPSWTRGAPILHIELRRWADLLVIAPMSANLLAKIANGLCDSLLTCVIRAWDTSNVKKKILVAPSMNTAMWNHPLTARQLATLRDGWDVPAAANGAAEDGSAPKTIRWYEVLLPMRYVESTDYRCSVPLSRVLLTSIVKTWHVATSASGP